MRPGDTWRQAIAERAVPEAISGQAPWPPRRGLEPERFRWRPEVDAAQPQRPSRRRAMEALPEGGTVLDVGCGGGASSLGLAPTAGLIVGVDRSEAMLASFEESARAAGIAVRASRATGPTWATRSRRSTSPSPTTPSTAWPRSSISSRP